MDASRGRAGRSARSPADAAANERGGGGYDGRHTPNEQGKVAKGHAYISMTAGDEKSAGQNANQRAGAGNHGRAGASVKFAARRRAGRSSADNHCDQTRANLPRIAEYNQLGAERAGDVGANADDGEKPGFPPVGRDRDKQDADGQCNNGGE